jgi:hypothetical protein
MRLLAVGLLALLIGAIAFTGASYWWLTPVVPCMVGLWLMRRDRCEHLYPALLPAIRHADGTTLPAKWFCCDCGESWAVGPSRVRAERTSTPRLARGAIMSTPSSMAGSPSDQVA